MISNIHNVRVEGRAQQLAAMLKRELAAAYIQKLARGFITRITRSIPLIKIARIRETIMLSQMQLLVFEEFLVLEVVNIITEIIVESGESSEKKATGLMGFLGSSMYQLQGGVETVHLKSIIETITDETLASITRNIVIEGIKENTAQYLKNRSHVNKNPVITLINVLINDAVDSMVPTLVKRAIKEIVDEYIENLHETYIYNKIIDSYLHADGELFVYTKDNKNNDDKSVIDDENMSESKSNFLTASNSVSSIQNNSITDNNNNNDNDNASVTSKDTNTDNTSQVQDKIDNGRDANDADQKNNVYDANTNAIAIKLQQILRGRLARKKILQNKNNDNDNDKDNDKEKDTEKDKVKETQAGNNVKDASSNINNNDNNNNDDDNSKNTLKPVEIIPASKPAEEAIILKPSEMVVRKKLKIGTISIDNPDLISTLAYESFFEEYIMDIITNEVVSEHTRESSLSVLSTMKQELTLAWRQEDLRKIGECFQQTIMKRLLIQHLVMHISYDFESIRLEYLVRGILNRQAAGRLLTLIEEAERRTKAVKDNVLINQVAKNIILPSLLDDEINFFLSTSKKVESHIDAIETAMMNDSLLNNSSSGGQISTKNNYDLLPKPPTTSFRNNGRMR